MNRNFFLTAGLACFLHGALAQTQLIVNGGFETGAFPPWNPVGAGTFIDADPVDAHSGTRCLIMGNQSSAAQTVDQAFTVPTNAAAAVLRYFWKVQTSSPGPAHDFFRVSILNSDKSSILASVDVQTESTSVPGFYFPRVFDLTPFAGQTIVLRFAVAGSLNAHLTAFFIDDVSVLVGTSADVPVNDSFTNAIVLTNAPFTVSGLNTFASKEPGEPNHAGNSGGRSLWWRWTASGVGTVKLNTTGSSFSTLLAVYNGSSVSNLTRIAADDSTFGRDFFSDVRFSVSPGIEYAFAVDGVDGLFGTAMLNLTFIPDTKVPTVSFTSPKSGSKTTNSFIVVKGKASDNLAVESVEFRLENAAGTNDYQLASGTNVWTATVTNLIPGLNTVRVRSFDTSSNVSKTVTRSFKYVVMNVLTLTTSGNGSVSPTLNGKLLEVGTQYTVTAKPGTDYLFAGWSGDVTSLLAKLKFTMLSNMVFQANFVPNPFIPLVGNYQGLFYDPSGIVQQSSGFFNATVSKSGAFSAKALNAGKSYSVSGLFNLSGGYSNTFARPGLTPLTLQLQLDLAGDTISGTLSDTIWTAQIFGHRAVFSKTVPAPQAGKYTLLIPGAETSDAAPGGDSIGAVTVSGSGTVTLKGLLADGAKLSQGTFVSGQGQWPLYVAGKGGSSQVLGWMTITNLGTNEIDGLVSWIKPAKAGAKFYPNGFTNETQAAGSKYVFSNGIPVLNVSTGQVWLANGNLPQNITNEVVLGANNKAVGTTNAASLSITTSSGLFKGSIPNPSGGKAIPVNGVVLQLQNFGGGYFSGSNQVGRVRFEP